MGIELIFIIYDDEVDCEGPNRIGYMDIPNYLLIIHRKFHDLIQPDYELHSALLGSVHTKTGNAYFPLTFTLGLGIVAANFLFPV